MIKRKYWIFITTMMLVLGVGGWNVAKYKKPKIVDTDKLITEVSRLMVLPDEIATIATVTDTTKLINQQFFKNAQNGDVVLMFEKSAKAIIYRPSIKKIVDIGPITFTETGNPSSKNVELTESQMQIIGNETATIGLYNGTKTVGLTDKAEKIINEKIAGVEVKIKEKAVNDNYVRSVIVDLSGKYSEKVAELAILLDAKVVKIPSGEAKPEADVMIILGKDFKTE